MSAAAQFIIRFVAGGLVVALVPVVASRFGPRAVGVLATIPIVLTAAFIVLSLDGGPKDLRSAAWAAVVELPVVFVYLVTIVLVSRVVSNSAIALGAGFVVWLGVSLLVAMWLI